MERTPHSKELIDTTAESFVAVFGRSPHLVAVAPGRVNLIGEHTDYSEGWVLPCAVDRHVVAVAAPRADRRVRVWSCDFDRRESFEIDGLAKRGDFVDYAQGVYFALAEKGLATRGLDIAVAGDLPIGSGLSSSAALGLALMGVADLALGLGLDARERARLVHRGESHFVGVGCGILDPFACALGRRDHALRIDCRSEEIEAVPFASHDFAILIVHSGIERSLQDGPYRDRVAACEAAIAAARDAGVAAADSRTLRDLGLEHLPALQHALDDVLFRRARHVISENQRVHDFCAALATGDRGALGRLLAASHRSLRDDFEVSIPELDFACEAAADLAGIVGSRLTGAGFGGCTLHLVETSHLDTAREALAERIAARFGERPSAFGVRTADGAAARHLAR